MLTRCQITSLWQLERRSCVFLGLWEASGNREVSSYMEVLLLEDLPCFAPQIWIEGLHGVKPEMSAMQGYA